MLPFHEAPFVLGQTSFDLDPGRARFPGVCPILAFPILCRDSWYLVERVEIEIARIGQRRKQALERMKGRLPAAVPQRTPEGVPTRIIAFVRPILGAPFAVRLPINTMRPSADIFGSKALARNAAESTWMRHIAAPSSAESSPSGTVLMKPAACTNASHAPIVLI